MSYFLAELYSAKPSWKALSGEARAAFFARIGAGMSALSQAGIEVITTGAVNTSLGHASPHEFFALWRCRDRQALSLLVEAIADSGWHDYFDTVNAGGEGAGMANHLQQLAAV
ncbi:hypothetical protein O9X99_19465 [Agrobacterium salinitolerans]|uniref:Uncharacterized protein n=1 Tax=Agrobacterium salinitolerans TaxID=1183413 RepID=A0A9X3KRT4_9HYPH|nr:MULTISPECIES: DUF6616 family protein [Agrobacterium]MCZ7893858.1 hypothetical protein [Agrobacterium salinitolerans]MCZ7939013.1 hypothetical protein [Agrobacterium salinitolerans]TRA86970.1 hypothetical protein EXN23_18235 [Agrobacterium salinitolerans]